MLVVKTNPVGIDIPVQKLQTFLFDALKKRWGVVDDNLFAYGRCYRNKVDKGYVPEVFESSADSNNTIYRAIEFVDDVYKALFFFDVDDRVKYDAGNTLARVELIFIVHLPSIKPGLLHRGDEEARNDAEKLCSQRRFGFTMNGFETGFRNVFSRFDGLLNDDQLTFRDQHPLHVFKINFDLLYSINDC
jgi:hypothetical protein